MKHNVRINDVTHQGNGAVRATACGLLWVTGLMIPPVYPRGEWTDEPVDCLACLAKGEA